MENESEPLFEINKKLYFETISWIDSIENKNKKRIETDDCNNE